jgi:hypothetical protein
MMRVPATVERVIWGLVRANIAAGGWQRRAAEAVADALRPPPSHSDPTPGQLALWVVDADGLPPRPWRVHPHDLVGCATLHAIVPAHVCVARQLASEVQRTNDTWRGQGSSYPSCVTERCAQGRGIREAMDPGAHVTWRGHGAGGRVEKRRSDLPEQYRARLRLAAVGLLDETPTIDRISASVADGDNGETSDETATARPGATVRQGPERQPQGPAGVGPRDPRSVRAQVSRGAGEGRRPNGERDGREGPARRGDGDTGSSRGETVLARASQDRGDRS